MVVRGFDLLRTNARASASKDDAVEWEEVLYYGSDGTHEAIDHRIPARLAQAIPENVVSFEERTQIADTRPTGGSGQPAEPTTVIDLVDRLSDLDVLTAELTPAHEFSLHSSSRENQ